LFQPDFKKINGNPSGKAVHRPLNQCKPLIHTINVIKNSKHCFLLFYSYFKKNEAKGIGKNLVQRIDKMRLASYQHKQNTLKGRSVGRGYLCILKVYTKNCYFQYV